MGGRNFFIVSIFLVYVLVLLGMLLGQRLIDLDKVCADDVDGNSGMLVVYEDIDGDGYNDLIIDEPYADPGGRIEAGETNLISGGCAIITAHGLGGSSLIKEFDNYGNPIRRFIAFGPPNTQGEVHLAVGDVDGDERDEIAAGQGEGGDSWVKLFEMDGTFIRKFKAFGTDNFQGEVHLAIGNFNSNLHDKEIAVAHGEGGQSLVKIFRADGSQLRKFRAFGPPNAQGEVHLAAADFNNDGIDEIVAGMGEGGSSLVKIFNHRGTLIRKFTAFGPAGNPGGEVHLTVGNFDADAALEIAVATGYNGGNWVRLFEKDGTSIRRFLAFGPPNTNGEVHIAAADLDNDGVDEIIVGMGEGGSSLVKIFSNQGTLIRRFTAFGPAWNPGGEVHLASGNFASDTFLIGDSPECDFSTIKSAVESDLVDDRDILEVLPGTYLEDNIIINKSITIRGQEGKVNSTIIDSEEGFEPIFEIQAHGVTIEGLTMANCWETAIFIDHKKNCQITGNKFIKIFKGVILQGSDQNQIKDNIFNNPTRAIALYRSSYNNLISNKFYNAHREGIRLGASSNNNISNNYFESADHEAIILANASNKNTITGNTINEQSKGIDSNLGISISSSSYNVIKNNIIKNCNHNIFIHQVKNQELCGFGVIPTGNIVEENTASGGKDGILIRAAKNNEIKNNIIRYNDRGLVIFSSSKGNSIVGNTFTYNNQEGILIHSDSPGNTLSNNIEYSNYLGDYTFSFPSEFNLYFGDIHGHTHKSDGRGSVDELYIYARDIIKLNISAVSDHAASRTHMMTKEDWDFTRERAKHYYQPNKFVTFSGYEWTDLIGPYNHHNVYYLSDDGPLIPARPNPDFYHTGDLTELADLIRASGKDFIIIPHHGLGKLRYKIPNPPERIAAEICSIHGRSEFYQNEPIRTWFKNAYGNVQDGLKTGLRLGIIGSSDTHRSLPGEWGIFGVYAEDLTRESIFDSIKERRTYGTTGARIGLWVDINDHMMGEEFSLSENPTIYVKVKGERNINQIEIIKHIENSSVYPFPTVHSEYPGQREFEFEWTDTDFKENCLYYVRVTQEDGEMAWSSPVWVKFNITSTD